MKIKSLILLLTLIVGASAFAGEQKPAPSVAPVLLLNDGFMFQSVDGVIKKIDDGDTWGFAADTDVTDGRMVLRAGAVIELLPSATLGRITKEAQSSGDTIGVRIWGTVTKYSRKNFLFCRYYIPLTKSEKPEEPLPQKNSPEEQKKEKPSVSKQDSIIPADVMVMLKPKRVVNLAKLEKVLEIEGDVILANRTGFIVERDGIKFFQVDSLGRNVEGLSFRLLPCQVLEHVQRKTARSVSRQRYRIAGVISKYKGNNYILLHRAVRTYSHGNFAR